MSTKFVWFVAAIVLLPQFALAGAGVSFDLDVRSLTTNTDTPLDATRQIQYGDREWSETGVEQAIDETEYLCCGRDVTRYSRRIELRYEWISEQMWPRTRQLLCAGEIEVTHETRCTDAL